MIFWPPMNGGLQTKASNPPRSSNTSGNSSGQWKVGRPSMTFLSRCPELFQRSVLDIVTRLNRHAVVKSFLRPLLT